MKLLFMLISITRFELYNINRGNCIYFPSCRIVENILHAIEFITSKILSSFKFYSFVRSEYLSSLAEQCSGRLENISKTG